MSLGVATIDGQTSTTTRLLIVDDEPIRMVLARAFTLLGYETTQASNGHEALAQLKHTPHHLMLLDLHMPGPDGLEVLRRAREIQPGLSVVVLTGHPTLESAIDALRADVVDYLQKPAGLDQVIDAVTQALQKRAARQHKEQLAGIVLGSPHLLKTADDGSEHQPAGHPLSVNVPPLTLDFARREVEIDAPTPRTVSLSRGETAVLASLLSQPGEALSCVRLVSLAWGYQVDSDEAESIIRPYISRLRHKLEENPKQPRFLHTVRGHGYRLWPSGE